MAIKILCTQWNDNPAIPCGHLRYAAPNGMIIPAIPCLRAGMPDYGMQACDLKKNKY
jgi:hypothetical protein